MEAVILLKISIQVNFVLGKFHVIRVNVNARNIHYGSHLDEETAASKP